MESYFYNRIMGFSLLNGGDILSFSSLEKVPDKKILLEVTYYETNK
jgi:hypothetical protein